MRKWSDKAAAENDEMRNRFKSVAVRMRVNETNGLFEECLVMFMKVVM